MLNDLGLKNLLHRIPKLFDLGVVYQQVQNNF